MSRSIFPKVFTDYVEIKPWKISEKDKEEVLSVVSRDKESESVNAGNKIASSLLNIVDTTIAGAFFYFFQNYNESHDTAKFLKDSFINPSSNSSSISIKDETDIDEHTRDGLMVCGIALLAAMAVGVAMKNYVFAANDVANAVKDKISKMSPEDLVKASRQIEEDLSSFEVPKESPFGVGKMYISYAIAGLATNFSGLPEDKQYLLFAASRVALGELLDIADNAIKRGNVKLFEEDFLNEFSDEEKDKLKKAIKSEIESNIDKNNCSEGLIKFSTELAKVFAFLGTLHNATTSSLISEEVFASAANFGAASLVSNVVRLTAESLNNYSKIREHPQVEELDDGDVEMGVNGQGNVGEGGYSPLESQGFEVMEIVDIQGSNPPNLKISKRSKSENDLISLEKQGDHVQPLMKSKSENNLIK